MGAQLTYGTAGATGGGFSAQPASLQESFGERRGVPQYSWQARSPRTQGDPWRYVTGWSFGGRFAQGGGSGSDGDTGLGGDMMAQDWFEPPNAYAYGHQGLNFLRGTCKDSGGTVVANAIVQGFVAATDAFVGQVQGNTDGTYTLGTEQLKSTAHYLVAYKAGSPDIAGTTVNTLLPTNVDGTS